MKMGDGEHSQMLTLPKHMGLVFSKTLRRRYPSVMATMYDNIFWQPPPPSMAVFPEQGKEVIV